MFLRESRKDAVQQLKRSHGGEARQDAIDIGCGLANLHHLGYYMRAELVHNLGHHFCRLCICVANGVHLLIDGVREILVFSSDLL